MPTKNPEKKKEIQKRADEKRRGSRALAWNMILYPDSAPEDWRERIEEHHIQWIESPLHDKDENPTGETKKAHWHILLVFDGVKTLEQVKEITKDLNGTVPIQCKSQKGTVRYMIHMDNPEKYQYDKSGIIAHGGANVDDYFQPTETEIEQLIIEMEDFIVKYNVTEFMDLMYYARSEKPDWHSALIKKSYAIERFINSRRHGKRNPVNPVTGEFY